MLIHKDIIIRVIFSFIFIAITFRVLGPIFFKYLKKKLPGQYTHESDIDAMIRRQKERLRAQYGLQGDVQSSQFARYPRDDYDENSNRRANHRDESQSPPPSKEIEQIYKETKWGGGEFLKEIQHDITKNYSYTLADTKVNAFILLCEKRNYLRFLTPEHRASKTALKNYLVTLLIFFLLIEEIREKKYYILEKIAKKLGISSTELALAFQIKLLMVVSLKKELKEDRIFSEAIVINQYSEETIKEASEVIAKREANLWAKSPSQLFEELTLMLNYASMLTPIPRLKNKKDVDTACEILGINLQKNTEDIKKIYKKIALIKHPDKIVSQKLPKILESKAIERFNQIQEAYEVVIAHKK
ncbi:MAG: DnaJ domain-containing protein [Bacteriovorax sp.]|nr:DnaJ domain-containing protein [Bacteriovorax sp.]